MRSLFICALSFLLIAAVIGSLLRLIYVMELPWLRFERWEHAHSHVAMLGWVFIGLFVALLDQDEEAPRSRLLPWLFTLALAAAAGMLIAFPQQNYGPV